MLTSGELLKKRRLEKGISLEEVEKKTRIRQKFITNLENGQLDMLPGKTYVQGFVKNYAEFLGLSVDSVLAVLRREFNERKKGELMPKGMEKPLGGGITKKITVPLALVLALVIFGIYAYSQYRILGGAPDITIESPSDGYLSQNDIVEIKGKTDKDNRVFINGQEISLDTNGNFTQKVTIQKGNNKIIIAALSKAGKEKKIERIVIGDNP